MPNIAECPDCGKRYKVPHFDNEWYCKVCEVALLAEDGTVFEEPEAESEQAAPREPVSSKGCALSNSEQRDFRKRARMASQKAASRRNWLVGIGLLILVFGGGGTIYAMTRGRPVETVVDQFRIAWNEGNYQQASQLAPEDKVLRWAEVFDRRDKAHGWNGKPPTLGKHLYLIDDTPSEEFVSKKANGKYRGAVLVTYESESGFLIVEFARRQGDWCFVAMDVGDYE